MNRHASVLRVVASLLLSSIVALSASALSNVWINEFHYDDTGTDTNEFVEIAGDAGIDLSGFSLLFYNGNDSSLYRTVSLSGIIANIANGIGFLSFDGPSGGIQNGDDDAIALYDGVSIIQFLSYEGSLTAIDGAAAGLTSVDIGVSEPGNTSEAFSLQLTGSGRQLSDFSWSGPVSVTRDTMNTGQTIAPLATTPNTRSVPDSGSTFLLLAGAMGLIAARSVSKRRLQ